jgi:hypothetical protein
MPHFIHILYKSMVHDAHGKDRDTIDTSFGLGFVK